MATRSTISIRLKNGSINSVYCHWDGYLSNNGSILLNYYKSPIRVKRLVAGGDISSLGKFLNPRKSTFHYEIDYNKGKRVKTNKKHSHETKHKYVTCFYKRDRQESDCDMKIFHGVDEIQFEEFNYLYEEASKKWYVETEQGWNELTNELIQEESNY